MPTWYAPYQQFLSKDQALKNAQIIANVCIKQGWSKNAICAICGNAWHESSVNPNMYEKGYAWNEDRGYGIWQWTPRSKLENWAKKNGLDFRLGETQVKRLSYETTITDPSIAQYFPTRNYPETFKEFMKSTKSVDYLTKAFMYNYERPNLSVSGLENRLMFANLCASKLDFSGNGSNIDLPEGTTSPPDNSIIGDGGLVANPIGGMLNILDVNEMINNFIEKLNKSLNDILTVDVYRLSNDFYSNDFLTLSKQLDNTYKIKPNINFKKSIDKITNTISNYTGLPNGIVNDNPNERPDTKPAPTPDKNANEKITTMTKKAFSYPNKSVRYSMNPPRNMVQSGDCSSFVNIILNSVGLNVGNGGTLDLYNVAKSRGWLVVDGYTKDVESIISNAKEGDYILMSKTHNFGYGGASHTVYVYSHTWIRHQTSTYGYGPINSQLPNYCRALSNSGYFRWALCRPFK